MTEIGTGDPPALDIPERALTEYLPMRAERDEPAFTWTGRDGAEHTLSWPGLLARVQALAAHVVETYDGDTAALWTGVSDGRELFARIAALPGFGTQKAQIFTALLGKQRGVTPQGWREAAGAYGEDGAHRSVDDVVDPESLVKVREFKQAAKAAAKAARA